ncbi:aspartyl-phosphate phosphatase Spo0E family protein [Brevibacillus nitrificans]|nr:aspartyl-phosphate phosphatase Spo0E family protein [Brevibacillus nitrificans]
MRELIINQIEKARSELYQAAYATGSPSFSGAFVLKKSRKLDNLIYRYLKSVKTGEGKSERNRRAP